MTALLVRCRFPLPLCREQNMNLERRIAVSCLVWSQCGCNAGRHNVKHVWGHSCCETLPLLCLSPVISCRWKQLCRMPAVAGYRSCPSLQSIRHCWEPSSRSGRSSRNWPWPRGWVLCDSVRSLPPPPWNVWPLLAFSRSRWNLLLSHWRWSCESQHLESLIIREMAALRD